MILRNHGLLVGGGSIAEAFDQIYVSSACQAQVAAQAGGAKLTFRRRRCVGTRRRSSTGAWTTASWTWRGRPRSG